MTHGEPAPSPGRTALIWSLFAAGLVVLVVAAVGVTILLTRTGTDQAGAATPEVVVTVAGTLVLADSSKPFSNNKPCVTAGPYADIQTGSKLTISAGGTALASGILTGGFGQTDSECDFNWAIAKVPLGQGSYTIALAGHGEITIDESTLDRPVRLTVGPNSAKLAH